MTMVLRRWMRTSLALLAQVTADHPPVPAQGDALGGGRSNPACFHTMTNRWTQVMAVRTSMTHRIGTSNQ